MNSEIAKTPQEKLSALRLEVEAKEDELNNLLEKLKIEEEKEVRLQKLSQKYLKPLYIKFEDEKLGDLSHKTTFGEMQEVLQGLGFEFPFPEDIRPLSFADFLIFLVEARLAR